MSKAITARNPNAEQRKLIRTAGLNPAKWLVRHENDRYLYLTDRGIEQRADLIIDKIAGDVVARKMP